MGKSIIQEDKRCWFCDRETDLEKHHVFGGVANRPISEREGLWIWCCHEDHVGKNGVQYNKEKNLRLKQVAQMEFEKRHPREEWMLLFRKNYVG